MNQMSVVNQGQSMVVPTKKNCGIHSNAFLCYGTGCTVKRDNVYLCVFIFHLCVPLRTGSAQCI